MEAVFNYANEQYKLVKESRQTLFDFCNILDPPDLVTENSSFGRGGSARNLLVHIANTYEFWIGNCALKKNIVFTTYASKNTLNDIRSLFDDIDLLMNDFLELFFKKGIDQVSYEIKGIRNTATSFKIFTHVITHEFHHKGQILSLCRHFGYTPADTDIMR
jgi:uncharacterized damage-inducible protein DinB